MVDEIAAVAALPRNDKGGVGVRIVWEINDG